MASKTHSSVAHRAQADGPLTGIRVVDLSSIGMGPFATQLLGDMGADVVKVETEAGDIFRHVMPQRHRGMGHAYLNLNRNKRSVVLDAKTADGAAALRSLIEDADVFVSNTRPSALARLGLSYEEVRKFNRRIIYCGCYGYSEDGPYRGRPSLDDVIQAASGMAWFQGVGAQEPCFVNSAVADKVLGLYVSNAISMALYEREKSGEGQAIEVPMFECMTAFMLPEHLGGLTFVPPEGPPGYARILNPYRKPFHSRDGFISVVPYTDDQWKRFFALSQRQDLADDARFHTPLERSRNSEALYQQVEDIVSTRSNSEWLRVLAEADIPHSQVNSVEDLITDPHLHATGFWRHVDHPTEGELLMTGIPIKFSGTPGSIRRHAPTLGEHTDEVLDELRRKPPRA